MQQPTETVPAELPNGPAQVTTDAKKERFKLEYAGAVIFQARVRLLREGQEMGLKEAGVRLFVVSKNDGWDVVMQTIRIAAVGVRPGDTVAVCGHNDDLAPSGQEAADHAQGAACDNGIYCRRQDWLLSVDAGSGVQVLREDVAARSGSGLAVCRTTVTAKGVDVFLRFRPHYAARHGAGQPCL